MKGPSSVPKTNPFNINNMFKKISFNKAEERMVAPKKKFLHEGLIRNDVNVPHVDSQICTKKFLIEVKHNKTFMFGIAIIRKLPCPSPPPLHILNHLVIKNLEKALTIPGVVPEVEAWERLIKHLKARSADKLWCLEILSTLN